MSAPALRTPPRPPRRPPSGRSLLRYALLLAGLIALVALAHRFDDPALRFGDWIESRGAWAPIAYVIGYALLATALVSGAALTLLGGALFGLSGGTLYTLAGATLGASLSFWIARYAARASVEARLRGHPRFEAIDGAIGREGRKVVFLLRLVPFVPFVFLNYALGLTRIGFGDYLLGSLGMLPATLVYVYTGTLLGAAAAQAGGSAPVSTTGEWLLLGLGFAASLAVLGLLTRSARRALHASLDGAGATAPGSETRA